MNYEEKIIAYIDILGFKKYIDDTIVKGNQNDLYRILYKFKDLANTHPLKRPNRQSTHFSDLLVISTPVDKRSVIDLINDLSELTHSFISSGLLLRGIIIKGRVLHENGIIFGPGLINAFLLEKEKVKFPRIIIAAEVVEKFNLEKDAVSDLLSSEGGKKLLSVDPFDHEYFINYFTRYLDHSKSDKQPKTGIFKDVLLNLILVGLNNEDMGIKQKYQWMVNWHNSYLKEYLSKIEKDYEFNKSQIEEEKEFLKSKFI